MNRVCSTLMAAVIVYGPNASNAQDNESSQPDQRAKSLQAASLARAKDIRMSPLDDGPKIELVETPILRFGDPARKNDAGSVWIWGKSGRPAAIAEIYRSTTNPRGASWTHVLSLSSSELVHAETHAGRWSPQSSHFEIAEIDDVSAPSDKRVVRLRQMKSVVRRLTAHELWKPDNTRYDLRLLVTPLYRYSDRDNGLIDGAIFTFAYGTNPEILVFVEARAKKGEPAKWSLGFAPLGSAELVVEREKETVWRKPRTPGVVGGPSLPYWLFLVPDAPLPKSSE